MGLIDEVVLRMFYEYGATYLKLGDASLSWKQAEQKQEEWIKENHEELKGFYWHKEDKGQ